MKSMKLASLFLPFLMALSISPQLSKADGSFSSSAGNNMSYGDAEAYCKDHGGHLPTAREMTAYAMSQGAAGLKETSLSGHVVDEPSVKVEIIQMGAQGYRMVQKPALWAPAVDFYYSAKGFQEDARGADAKFWTSSTDSSASSLARGMISLVEGNERKFTLSSINGDLGEDAANTGRNNVICATQRIPAPSLSSSGTETAIVTINPAQITFIAEDKTLYATISDSDSNAIESIALDTSNLGKDAKSIQAARDQCTDIAGQAASANKNLKLDLSYQKLGQFCTISDEVTSPSGTSNSN